MLTLRQSQNAKHRVENHTKACLATVHMSKHTHIDIVYRLIFCRHSLLQLNACMLAVNSEQKLSRMPWRLRVVSCSRLLSSESNIYSLLSPILI